MTNNLDQENNLFKITHNKKDKCYDLILKKPSYDTTQELAGIISWVHQLGVSMPNVKVRIGAMVEEPKGNAGEWSMRNG